MSQPGTGSGFSIDGPTGQTHTIKNESIQERPNGRASADIMKDVAKADLSNGFETRGSQSRPQQVQPRTEIQENQHQQTGAKNQIQQRHQQDTQQHQQPHLDERPASVPVVLTHQPYHENIVIDRVQFVSQGPAQPIPVHAAPYAPEYVIAAPDSLQYSQIHGALYNPTQAQYVSRDSTFRDPSLYAQNVAIAAAPGTYIQQPSQPQITSQPASSQPPTYYANKGIALPPAVAAGYVHFGPQIHYSQYPQTVVNAAPYSAQKSIYPQQYSQQQTQQSSSAQHSPNPQRFSQELSQYQGQPIIQPIAQNVNQTVSTGATERASRGPKPVVPPRINSKITHESGHRKSASLDVPTGQKPKTENNVEGQTGSEGQQVSDNQDKRYVVAVNKNARTRQDGLYVEANGEMSREQTISNDTGNSETSIYVSKSEHRKSVSVDVTSSFQRRNDTITFTFPNDSSAQQDSMMSTSRQLITNANLTDNKPVDINTSNFSVEQKRLDINATMRMSPMPVLPSLSVVPKGILVSGERKSVEWSSLSPNQRIVIPQENRRSDYFEEHRRSPMTVDGKRFEEIRRSPMNFIPIRDSNAAERVNQKSPNNLTNQTFEKTRAELAMWAEQRQRQEIESRILQNRDMYATTSPRSRNQSEERRPENSRNFIQVDKDARLSVAPSAFQPIANISQNSLIEQRRHLRHVSADLTKHMDLTRKEYDDQLMTGSVVNLGTTAATTSTTNVMSQRASPNICFHYPSMSEAKLDTKTTLGIIGDFNEIPSKPLEQVDHIIHSHRKSQNQTAAKNQENSQNQPEQSNDKGEMQHSQILQNQQSIDFISEKLSQCEKQQSDLQAKLQSLQNQNEILDKVAQFQYQQNDLQTRLHNLHLQNQLAERLSQKQSSEFSQTSSHDDQDQTNKSILNQCINASRQLYQQSLLPTVNPQLQATAYLASERVSPRLQFQQPVQEESDLSDSIQIPNISQMPLPSLSQFDRADVLSRSSYTQLQRIQPTNDNLDSIPSSQVSLTSLGNLNFTGTLKKIPPEKPPRTSLIAQSPDTESNRSQPAIGLKHTSKARSRAVGRENYWRVAHGSKKKWKLEERREEGRNVKLVNDMDDHEIQSTVESILGPDVKIIDCEKKQCVKEEEVLLINGVPITLDEPDGIAIREAMITGQVPPCELLNRILIRAGIQRVPVRLETSLNVKSSIVTKEEVTVARAGKIVDERSRETKENNSYSSTTSEIWEPIGVIHRPRNLKPFDSSDESRPNSNASSDQGYTTNVSSNSVLRERGGCSTGGGAAAANGSTGAPGCTCCAAGPGGSADSGCRSTDHLATSFSGLGLDNPEGAADEVDGQAVRGAAKVPGVTSTTSAPTIFGTVASDLNPKDGNSRRSLPQTPAGSLAAKALVGGGGAAGGSSSSSSGMVNGSSGANHPDTRDAAAVNAEQHELVYRDGNLVSGSLEALVQHMVPTEEYYPDRAYLFAFLLSARLFIKPHELLGEVCALCEHQQNLNGEGGKERLHRFVPRLVQLLAEWTETFPYDFRDERVMGHVRSITQKVANVDAAARQEVSVLLQNLLVKLTALERYEEALSRLANEAATESLTQVDVTELCPSATVLAQQLTHIELERLSYIGPEEFVQAFAKESPHLENSFKDMKKTRNLESYVSWFNRLSYFVATEVCKHAKKKQRVRVVEYWIETARECFNIGNFNSLMAIIAGLNMSSISRLKKTWSKVQLAKFSILEHQMDPSSNFSSYRSTLKAAMWRSAGATDERQRIVVPFFSLLVKDLYFLNEGCSNKLPNGHINFEKFWQLAKQVTEFIAWKQVACPFEKNSRVIAFLQASPVLTENALALASFECEPPDNNHEKDRYKALKSELCSQ